MARTYEVISADGHIEGPFDWAKRMPAQYKDAPPKLVQNEDGAYAWRVDYTGVQKQQTLGAGLYSGLRYDEFTPARARTYWNPDGSLRPGASGEDPIQRLREQDEDGIDAEVLFWPVGLLMVSDIREKAPDAYRAVIRMYNDFVAEYCSVAPDRLIGNCVLPWTNVDDAIAEIQHARKKGIRTVILQQWPNGSGDPKPEEDDRFWAAALDIGMRISPHGTFGAGASKPVPAPHDLLTPESALSGGGGANPIRSVTLAQLILHGTFDRFPNLKIYWAETQAAWLAAHLDQVDEWFQRWGYFHEIKLQKQPSEYIRDHNMFSFIHDRLAMKFRHYIGVNMLMWGTDFPHSVGTFPESRSVLAELFEGVPAAERRKVLVDNVCDFFGLDATKPLTETPGAKVAVS